MDHLTQQPTLTPSHVPSLIISSISIIIALYNYYTYYDYIHYRIALHWPAYRFQFLGTVGKMDVSSVYLL